jgi:hypothetical protein
MDDRMNSTWWCVIYPLFDPSFMYLAEWKKEWLWSHTLITGMCMRVRPWRCRYDLIQRVYNRKDTKKYKDNNPAFSPCTLHVWINIYWQDLRMFACMWRVREATEHVALSDRGASGLACSRLRAHDAFTAAHIVSSKAFAAVDPRSRIDTTRGTW